MPVLVPGFYKDFTAAQRAVLDARHDRVKMAIEVDDTTPLRWCTGADPIQIDGSWYTPRPMAFRRVALTDPLRSVTNVSVDDKDGDIRTAFYTSQFDCAATIYWLLQDESGQWVRVLDIEWYVKSCRCDSTGHFSFTLSAGAGSKPRNGGRLGTFGEFPYAPEPGEALKIGPNGGGVTWRPGVGTPPAPPGGHQMAYDPRGYNSSSSDGDTTNDDNGSGPTIPGGGSGSGSGSIPGSPANNQAS